MSLGGPAGQWLAGLCPRCEKGRLFAGPVRFADRCGECGLDYRQFNVGDGPAAFLILIVRPEALLGASFASTDAALAAVASDSQGNAVVNVDAHDSVTLTGVHLNQLHSSDFMLG